MAQLFALDQTSRSRSSTSSAIFRATPSWCASTAIDARLADLDDWQVLLALHHHDRPWDGLITTDTSMLNQALELAVLIQTKLTLVVTRAAGHNPVKASGLLFAYLSRICERTSRDRPQVWVLAAGNRPPKDAWTALGRVAEHNNVDAQALFSQFRLADDALARDPLIVPQLGG